MEKGTLSKLFNKAVLGTLMVAVTSAGFVTGAQADQYYGSPQAQSNAANCEVYHADGRANLARTGGLTQEQYAARTNQIESQFAVCMQNSGVGYAAAPQQGYAQPVQVTADNAGAMFATIVLGTMVGHAMGHHGGGHGGYRR